MAKKKFYCTECKNTHSKWTGVCNYCSNWNSIFEIENKINNEEFKPRKASYVYSSELDTITAEFRKTGFNEFDTVVGGGIVDGAVIILSGGPGVGKSTLLLKVMSQFSLKYDQYCLYCSGEESLVQMGQRIKNLNLSCSKLLLLDCSDLNEIKFNINESNSKLVVIDSLQMIRDIENDINGYSHSSLKILIDQIVELAKTKSISFILINQVIKDGNLAGPKYVEHMVDIVLDLKKSKSDDKQIVLKPTKNRYGPIDKQSLLEFNEKGDLLSGNCLDILSNDIRPGRAYGVYFKNKNPFYFYVDVLLSKNKTSTGKRVSRNVNKTEFDVIIAVIEKKFRVSLENIDIYLSVYGPYDKDDNTMLTIASAIISSFKGKKLIDSLLFFGDFDFHGEVKNRNSEFLDFEFIDIPKGYKLVTNLQKKGTNNKLFTHITNITEIDQFFKNNND